MYLPTPPAYRDAFEKLTVRSVHLGYDGIDLYKLEDLPRAQRGYMGDVWGKGWLVIAHTAALGDPIIVDTFDEELPVMTAFHGMGEWKPCPVAESFKKFGQAMVLYSQIAQGREHPVALGKRPISSRELDEYVAGIRRIMGLRAADFWVRLARN